MKMTTSISGAAKSSSASFFIRLFLVSACFALLVAFLATETEASGFYPNGRYGRRSDPEFEENIEAEANKLASGGVNALTRQTQVPLICSYLGIADLFQCSLRSPHTGFRLLEPEKAKA